MKISRTEMKSNTMTAESGFGQMSDFKTVLESSRTAIIVRRVHVISETLIACCILAIYC